jgi:hypothetical protein
MKSPSMQAASQSARAISVSGRRRTAPVLAASDVMEASVCITVEVGASETRCKLA